MTNNKNIVVLFDGVCNFCNGSVQFMIRRDPAGVFRFASLQSEYGQSQLKRFDLPPHELYSIIVVEEDLYFQKSDAILKIARHLKSPWSALTVFKIIPRFIRDVVYELIAKNRYKLFGRKDECMIPSPELKARFLG